MFPVIVFDLSSLQIANRSNKNENQKIRQLKIQISKSFAKAKKYEIYAKRLSKTTIREQANM
jgi:hypothetical protein